MWLKIWFSTLEAAEEENLEAFEVDEAEEDAFIESMRKCEMETKVDEARAKQAAIAATVVRRTRHASAYGYS